MKRNLLLTILLLAACLPISFGQQGAGAGQYDNEKLTAYKIAFFTQKLNLTSAEAEKFWPLYNDYSAKKTKLQVDRMTLLRYAAQNELNMSDQELSSTADKLAQSLVDEANLSVNFNREVQKVLPPAKVIRLFQAENQYKQQLLRELNQRRQGQGAQDRPERPPRQDDPDI